MKFSVHDQYYTEFNRHWHRRFYILSNRTVWVDWIRIFENQTITPWIKIIHSLSITDMHIKSTFNTIAIDSVTYAIYFISWTTNRRRAMHGAIPRYCDTISTYIFLIAASYISTKAISPPQIDERLPQSAASRIFYKPFFVSNLNTIKQEEAIL